MAPESWGKLYDDRWFGAEEVAAADANAAEKMVDGFSEADRAKVAETLEKYEFQADVNRLMDIIINSLYTDKQVFLWKLVSSVADALEKPTL